MEVKLVIGVGFLSERITGGKGLPEVHLPRAKHFLLFCAIVKKRILGGFRCLVQNRFCLNDKSDSVRQEIYKPWGLIRPRGLIFY